MYLKSQGHNKVASSRVPHKHDPLPSGPELLKVLQHPPVHQKTLIKGARERPLWGVSVLDADDRDIQLTGPDSEVTLGEGRGGDGRGGGGGEGWGGEG